MVQKMCKTLLEVQNFAYIYILAPPNSFIFMHMILGIELPLDERW